MRTGRFLYVATHPNGLHKIGITRNPKGREKALRSDHRAPVSIVRTFECDLLDARSIEMLAHKALEPWRAHGEWFAVTLEEAIEAIDTALVERYRPLSTAEKEWRLRSAIARHQKGEGVSNLARELNISPCDLGRALDRVAAEGREAATQALYRRFKLMREQAAP